MAISSQHIYSGGIAPFNLGVALHHPLGSPKVSVSNAVYTQDSAFSASSVNSTAAMGTAPDVARNLVYRLVPNTGSAGLWSGGTLVAVGSDILGAAITETIAATLLNASTQIIGSKCFGPQGGTISFSNFSVHTASSSASASLSVYVGVGNRVGVPNAIQSSNAIYGAQLGLVYQTAYTAHTGPVPNAAVELAAFSSASAAVVHIHYSR